MGTRQVGHRRARGAPDGGSRAAHAAHVRECKHGRKRQSVSRGQCDEALELIGEGGGGEKAPEKTAI